MIRDLIGQVVEDRARLRAQSRGRLGLPDEDAPRPRPATSLRRGVPTLKHGQYRPFTPQLKERYELFGRWEGATHGHWLGLDDMEALWEDTIDEKLLDGIKCLKGTNEAHWPNDAAALFRPERLSLFAGSDLNNERIYLLWLDFEDEPEFWVYDSNGESRYRDLAEYLIAYLADDVSAAGGRLWHLAAPHW